MLNRAVTNTHLPGDVKSYNDLAVAHWAYANIMEAAIAHDAELWHGESAVQTVPYAALTEKYIDSNGTEIAAPTQSSELPRTPSKTFDGYRYLGAEITVVYTYLADGASGFHGGWGWVYTDVLHNSDAEYIGEAWVVPGDNVIYTLKIDNATDEVLSIRSEGHQEINGAIENATATVFLPSRLTYDGIVAPASVRVEYDSASHELTLYLGYIPIGESISVKIMTTVTKEVGVYREVFSIDGYIATDNYDAWGNQDTFGLARPNISPSGYKSQPVGALTVFDSDYPDGEKRP